MKKFILAALIILPFLCKADYKTSSSSKTTGTKFSRLLTETHFTYYSSADSELIEYIQNYNYSAHRGGDLMSPYLKFDNSTLRSRSAGAHSLGVQYYYEQTFDGADNRNSFISYFGYDSTISAFKYWYRDLYTNNSKGDVVSHYSANHDYPDTGWVNSEANFYSYNTSGKVDTASTLTWNGVHYVLTAQTIYSYNVKGDTLSILTRKGKIGLINSDLEKRTYRSYGIVESIETFNWNSTSSDWDKQTKKKFFYDPLTRTDTMYTYSFDKTTSDYKAGSRIITTKDARNNVLRSETQDNTYGTYALSYYEYDSTDHQTLAGSLSYNFSLHKLDTAGKTEMYYNDYGQMVLKIFDSYSLGKWNLAYQRYTYEYEEFELSFKENNIPDSRLKLYPVPSTDNLSIELEWPEGGDFTVLIYDIQGKTWGNWDVKNSQSYKDNISILQFPTGNYFMKFVNKQNQFIVRQFSVIH